MGTTAQKLSYLNETKTQLKSTINLTGANLTNDTFRSYPSKLYKKLLDAVVDSDTLFNNLPKVNGTGTDITLNNTDECKIKFNMLGGNTEQDSYTGKNLVGLAVGQSAEVSGITLTITDEGYLKLNGTASANINKSYAFVENPSQTYENIQYSLDSFYVSGTTSGNIVVNLRKGSTPSDISGQLNPSLFYINASDKKTTFTPGDTGYVTGIQIIINSGVSLNNFIVKLQLEEGNTMTDYEPYVGGTASPSPDSPQEIRNVSGIENYFNPTIEWIKNNVICQIENQEITFNGTSNNGATYPTAISNIPTGNYIITLEVLEGTHTNNRKVWIDFFNGTTKITNMSFTSSETSKTITFNSAIDNIKIGFESGDAFVNFKFRIMIEKGSVAHEYVPYGLWASLRTQNEDNTEYQTKYIDLNIYDNSGNVIGHNELCKIGDYRDYFKKNSGKNLLKNVATTTTTGNVAFTIKDNGIVLTNYTASGNLYFTLNEMKLSADTYTISGCASGGSNQKYKFLVFDVTAGVNVNSDYGSGMTFTAEEGHIYRFQIVVYSGCNTTGLMFKPQLEKGNQATPFEPYGKGWYLHKETGKIVLDGSESWEYDSTYSRFKSNLFTTETMLRGQGYSNYYKYGDSVNNGQFDINVDKKRILIHRPDSSTTTEQQFQSWLSTHNTEIYYALYVPTDTPITNENVINSLESIVKSYEDETHIVSVDDAPMYLDVSAVSKYSVGE